MEETPIPLVSSVTVAAELDIDRRTATKFANAGLLGTRYVSERGGWLVERAHLDKLAASKRLVPQEHPPAFVVRLDVATDEAGDARMVRRFRGWHAELVNEPTAHAAWDRWWPVANPAALRKLTVLAQLGPIIVAAETIIDVHPEFGRYRLQTRPELDPAAREAFLNNDGTGRWLPLPPGAVVAHLSDTRNAARY